jgi:hypothetical protein
MWNRFSLENINVNSTCSFAAILIVNKIGIISNKINPEICHLVRMVLQVAVKDRIDQWYSTFFVRVPPHIISLQLCTPKVVGA